MTAAPDLRSAAPYRSFALTAEANPRQAPRSRDGLNRAAEIARFYESVIGDVPYASFTIALTEHVTPGGHSPGYFAVLNQPFPNTQLVWRNDPASFEGFPEFFLAHEMAHQWWGQAVGWRNYHEQWLSEGFAQYFAALYAQHSRGEETFGSLLRQMRKWAIDTSDQGPVYLGYRLGHIRNEGRVHRALVYNKGGAVLHMLRRFLGDEAFFSGIRRFYVEARYKKAGTDDLRVAMEAESGRSLERFFERWIYEATLPRIKFSYQTDSGPEGAGLLLHVEQEGELFDIPITFTIAYSDRPSVDVVMPVSERITDLRVALGGTLRSVEASKNDGTLAEITRLP
jgi:aminopeptidase N